ncbi:MAG: glycerophosphodiester phosphodiesterase [Verrucomicrobiae bacterium]|nr:glycerophosphodiester phosphodiesterase [Verrucomicrobiae bacterium]
MNDARHDAAVFRLLSTAVLLWVGSLISFPALPAAPTIEFVAHRGASFDAPENTLAAMKMAWEQGADAIELDLWLSKDGKIVVCHDADTGRTAGVKRKIAEQTWAELQQLDVGAWKAPRFKGERIPTLEAILGTIPPGKRAVLEIKCGPEILPALEGCLKESRRRPEEMAIISFNYEALRQSKQRLPQHAHYFLHSYKPDTKTGRLPELSDLIRRAREAGFDGLDLHYDWPITSAFVEQVRAAGLELLVWTVDDPAVARRLVTAGVRSLTTNRPQWLRQQLQKSAPEPR